MSVFCKTMQPLHRFESIVNHYFFAVQPRPTITAKVRYLHRLADTAATRYSSRRQSLQASRSAPGGGDVYFKNWHNPRQKAL